MCLLDRREPAINFFQLRVGLGLGHRAIERGTVDLALKVGAIARDVALALGRIDLRHFPPSMPRCGDHTMSRAPPPRAIMAWPVRWATRHGAGGRRWS